MRPEENQLLIGFYEKCADVVYHRSFDFGSKIAFCFGSEVAELVCYKIDASDIGEDPVYYDNLAVHATE